MSTYRVRKRKLRVALDRGRLRYLWRGVFDLVIALEVVTIRVADALRRRPPSAPGASITAIVKTFERPLAARRLVSSIRRLQPDVQILVADDSRTPVAISGSRLIPLPYNSGVSAGRNALLSAVETPFFVMLDDDFVFTRSTDLRRALDIMERHEDIDLLAGRVVNLPDFGTVDYSTSGLFPHRSTPLRPPGSLIAGLPVVLKAPNFFVGRTARVRLVGWSDELKFIDHLDFFTRACGMLVTVQDDRMVVMHARNPFDRSTDVRQQNLLEARAVLRLRYLDSSRI